MACPVNSEQFQTDYTETDPNSRITLTSECRIDFAGLARNEAAHVIEDKDAAHFDGNFTHHFTAQLTTIDGAQYGITYIWALGNGSGTVEQLTNSIAVRFYGNNGTPQIQLEEDTVNAGSYAISLATPYYLEIERDIAVGTYGTVYCRIYSDAARTTLLSTLTATLAADLDYQYIYPVSSHQAQSYTDALTGYVENLDINEDVTGTGTTTMPAFVSLGSGSVDNNEVGGSGYTTMLEFVSIGGQHSPITGDGTTTMPEFISTGIPREYKTIIYMTGENREINSTGENRKVYIN